MDFVVLGFCKFSLKNQYKMDKSLRNFVNASWIIILKNA